MTWKDEIRKAPFLDIGVKDLLKALANVELALKYLNDGEWEQIPDFLKHTHKKVIEALDDAKLVLDRMEGGDGK